MLMTFDVAFVPLCSKASCVVFYSNGKQHSYKVCIVTNISMQGDLVFRMIPREFRKNFRTTKATSDCQEKGQ